MERSALAGIAVFRGAAWVWMSAVLLATWNDLDRAWLALFLAAAALGVTVEGIRRAHLGLVVPTPFIAIEVVVGSALLGGDGIVYGPGHALSISQTLGVAWPLCGVLAAGVVLGPVSGAGVGLLLGAAKWAGAQANDVAWDGDRVISLASTTVLFMVGGVVAGLVASLLKRAEREISAARAREEVSRQLHDGVLQTLALIERRADDPALARLAHEQERELREWLFGAKAPSADLARSLRRAAARFEDRFDGRAEVVLAPDVPRLPAVTVQALSGAVGEALSNAGRHGDARRVVVYVEPDEAGLFCSVKDDGCGFDTARVAEGEGMARSLRGRLEEVGGRAEVESHTGTGTEVRMWLPC